MEFEAYINIMPHPELLDPQGKAVAANLPNVGIAVKDVRIGKRMLMKLEAADEAEAKSKVEEACKKMLANPVMEFYEYEIKSL